MKKVVAIIMFRLYVIFTLVGCNSISKEDYDKLNDKLTTVQEENDVLRQKQNGLNNIKAFNLAQPKKRLLQF